MKFKKLTNKQFDTLVKIFVIFALAYFISGVAMADTIKVAVIDTGFDFKSDWSRQDIHKPKLCKEGHKSFTGSDIQDRHKHGTHIAGLIGKDNGLVDYCLVIIKVFEPSSNNDALDSSLEGFKYAVSLDVDIINYSGGGSNRSDIECAVMVQALNKGIYVITAAGNEYSDLQKRPYYPAMCDNRIYKIAATTGKNSRLPASNYTSKYIPNFYNELGYNVISLLPNNLTGVMTGTSQAAAIFTQKLVRSLYMYRIEQAIKLNRTA